MIKRFTTLFLCGLLLSSVFAADAPQFRGADRTGVFEESGLLKTWPETGPPLAWMAKALARGSPPRWCAPARSM
ncbi:MAG: hypothetical protein HC889_10575 [Synechococcaceae cyanobacterium SM1_2_3]|nr:hypothetical protein [Synechococcaceae cyanobacterium SM1_2_3]